MNPLTEVMKFFVPDELEKQIAKLPHSTGSYDYDPWGFNADESKLAVGIVKKLYDEYFRVQAHGLENIPAQGRVLLIGNHSGQLPIDGMLIAIAMLTNTHGPRAPRAMIERFFPMVPFVGDLLNRTGAVIGDPVNCARMLDNEEAIIVFPEGVRGSGKLYKQRYQLQRFGNGFMHLAINHRTPIIPVGVVGCEETMPSLANLGPIARLLGLPYLPVTTYVPLPARVSLYFGEPLWFDADSESETEMTTQVETVKDAIRALIARGLDERESVF